MTTALPVVNTINTKNLIIKGLKQLIADQLPDLTTPFDFTTSYPTRETFQNDENGDIRQKRRVVIRRLKTTPQVLAIGDAYTSDEESVTYYDGSTGTSNFNAIGWVSNHMIEITVLSIDPDDRDTIIELINYMMLELVHGSEEGRLPFFEENGIVSCTFSNTYEDEDYSFLGINGAMHLGILVYNLIVPQFRVNREDYQKVKVNLIAELMKPIPDITKPFVTSPSSSIYLNAQNLDSTIVIKDAQGLREVPDEIKTVGQPIRLED